MPNAASCGHDGLRVLAAPLSAPSIGHSSSAWCIVDGGNQAAKGSGRKLRYRGRKRRKAWKMAARREGNKGGGNGFIKTIPVARGAWSKPRVRNNERVSPVHVPVHVYVHIYTPLPHALVLKVLAHRNDGSTFATIETLLKSRPPLS